jgi:hypothetical protein
MQSYFGYSLLAQAAYATFDLNALNADGSIDENSVSTSLQDADRGNFTPTQADMLSSRYKVWHQFIDAGSGFGATLFQEKTGSQQYVLAFRGTEGNPFAFDLNDILADLEAGIAGVAEQQVVSMVNYYNRLTAPVGTDVTLEIGVREQLFLI